ncbi:MAG: GTPase Era [Gemmatimonadetes bacterium]|nr:GTPase Era [Gemmatimonadota bacterium]
MCFRTLRRRISVTGYTPVAGCAHPNVDSSMDLNDASPERAPTTRAGYVALLGFPNAGKSSLLNRLLDQKLSIVTPFPQTTRERVVGIDTSDGVQMIFVDTPGLVDPRYLLHETMLHAALAAIPDADVLLLLVDATQSPPLDQTGLLAPVLSRKGAVVAVINKIDVATANNVARVREWADEQGFQSSVEVSALEGSGVESLREVVANLLPISPYFYPPEEISSQPVRFFVAEFVRETIFELYKEEIPYSVAVRIEEYREAATPVYIRATIFVERQSQKGILIGSGGTSIRQLGQMSRQKIEAFIGSPVYLDLWIKVLSKWRRDPTSLKHLGYSLPSSEG